MPQVDRIRCYDFEGNFLQDFNSMSEAASTLGIGLSNIQNVVNDRSLHAKGFQFRRINTSVTIEKLPSLDGVNNSGRQKQAVAKYWDNRLIVVYNSHTEAARLNETSTAHITIAVSKGTKHKGFTFKVIN